jgi:predicted metal-dependent HD superfamily phosphohydrolase
MSIVKSTVNYLFPENSDHIYSQLHKAYTQPGRFYHTLEHIERLLYLVEAYGSKLQFPALVKIAILFHDFVYVVGREDNEHLSGIYAKEAMKQANYHQDSIDMVIKLIMSTNISSQPDTYDESFLREIDFSILAAPREIYHKYAVNIAKEAGACKISEFNFKDGRKYGFLHKVVMGQYAFTLFPEWNKLAQDNAANEYENWYDFHLDYFK